MLKNIFYNKFKQKYVSVRKKHNSIYVTHSYSLFFFITILNQPFKQTSSPNLVTHYPPLNVIKLCPSLTYEIWDLKCITEMVFNWMLTVFQELFNYIWHTRTFMSLSSILTPTPWVEKCAHTHRIHIII
jgi:hypothetical protein